MIKIDFPRNLTQIPLVVRSLSTLKRWWILLSMFSKVKTLKFLLLCLSKLDTS